VATVEIGCRRSLTHRAITEIVARNTIVVFLMALVGLLLARSLASRVAGPLEHLGTDLARLSGGDLGLPLVQRGPADVRAMGAALEQVREGLRQAGGYRGAFVRLLVRDLAASGEEGAQVEAPPGSGVVLLALPPAAREPAQDALRAWTEPVLDAILSHGGQVLAGWPGRVLAWWEVEGEEGAWTALLAADAVRRHLRRHGLDGLMGVEALDMGGEEGAAQVRELNARLASAAHEAAPGPRILVGERAAENAGTHPALRALSEGGPWELGNLADPVAEGLSDAPPEA
jgi:hypothetical protein